METTSSPGGAMPKIGEGETACLVCGVTVAHARSFSPDGSFLGERVYPVPADYPYCYFCHYNGRAETHRSAWLLSSISEVTGTHAEIWQTGGGTMTGVVFLSDDTDEDAPHAYFGIVHDDSVECAGYFGLCIFWDDEYGGHFVTQDELWGRTVPDWIGELDALWASARDELGLDRNDTTHELVVAWFRLVWAETVRVLDAHRDEWGRDAVDN